MEGALRGEMAWLAPFGLATASALDAIAEDGEGGQLGPGCAEVAAAVGAAGATSAIG